MSVKIVLVAACALVDADGRVLIAQRPQGKTMAGLWEFPGGKLDLAMQLILTPMILQLMERSRRAGGQRKNVQAQQKTA